MLAVLQIGICRRKLPAFEVVRFEERLQAIWRYNDEG
jgi:hypothetical protein